MNREPFQTPVSSKPRAYDPSIFTASKRDSLAAELERDPQTSTVKRQQRTAVFNSSMAHASLERQLSTAQTAKAELEIKLRERDLQIERLERDRRWLADREKEEREEKERERETYEEAKRKSDTEIRTLRTSLTSLREEFADLQDSHSSLTLSASQSSSSRKALITTLQHRITILSDELSQANQIASERTRTLAQLQQEYDELSAAHEELLHATHEKEDLGIVRDELQRQATYLRSLESKNAKLNAELNAARERQTSVEVLREEKRGLEGKLAVMGELREKVVRLEAELEAARKERASWASRSNAETSTEVVQTLSDLRLAHARLLEEHGATSATLRQREVELQNAEQRYEEAQVAVEELEKAIRTWSDEAQRREARTMLAEREVGYLEALLASYKAEEEAYTDSAPRTSVDETKLARLDELEALLVQHKTLNDRLAQELDEVQRKILPEQMAKAAEELERFEKEKSVMRAELEEAEKQIREHLATIDNLEQALFELSGEIAGGRHVPPNTRVLCMKENPDQEWFDLRQATFDQLKKENQALIERLKALQDSGVRGGTEDVNAGVVPRESWEQINREKVECQEEVQKLNIRLDRLRKVFAAKSQEFKDSIASILGLKLAFYPNGDVRVTSTYDLNASFVFRPSKGGTEDGMSMQLVAQGEGGPQDLPSLMQYWIGTEQCPAGLLASMTLECYDHWKRNRDEALGNQA